MIRSLRGRTPKLGKKVFVAENAQIIGEVEIGDDSNIWFNAVVRGDGGLIRIGKATNVQDNSILHSDIGYEVSLGDKVTIGHAAIIHGCKVSSNCIIGIGAKLLNGVIIGEWSIVGAGAVVTEGTIIPPYSIVLGIPGKIIRQTTLEDRERIKSNAEAYIQIKNLYLEL